MEKPTFPTLKYKTNLGKRIWATIIDYGLFLLFFLAYVSYFGHNDDEGGLSVTGTATLTIPIVWFIYFVVFEAMFNATLGHIVNNLKVHTVQCQAITFTQALQRHLLDFVDIFFYGIPAIIAIKNTEKHQRLGDLWAKTIVLDMSDPEQNSALAKI